MKLTVVMWLLGLLLAAGSEYRVLFFTASWCEPCKAVYAVLEKIETADRQRRVQVVTVDFDRAREEAEQRWGVHEIPVVIVLARDGKVLLRAEGAGRETLTNLESALRELIQPPKKRGKR